MSYVYASAKNIFLQGAGDCFIGSLAFLMTCKQNLNTIQMLEKASQIAAISVQAKGTQTSYPCKEDILHIL